MPLNKKARSFRRTNGPSRVRSALLDLARALFPIPFAGEGFFGTPFLSWLQVEGVSLDFFHDVLLLNFALETSQRALQSFAVLDVDFCH